MIDFKGIQFKYVKLTGGVPSIDSSMTDKKFMDTRPEGYFHCFVFKEYFVGYDYEVLQNFVSIEEKEMWNKLHRNTFFGYCEDTNEFICNINAYMGLKDSDLKTDGEINHPSQANWRIMELSVSKTPKSIIVLKQTDGSDVYLSIKDIKIEQIGTSYANVSGSMCIEVNKKKVSETSVFIKNSTAWVKSPEDGSAIAIRDNCPNNVKVDNYTQIFTNSNRIYDNTKFNYGVQASVYGKPVVYWKQSGLSPEFTFLHGFTGSPKIKNNSGNNKNFVEFTETSDLNDIIKAGESLTFIAYPKQGNYRCSEIRYVTPFDYTPEIAPINGFITKKSVECVLRSCDASKPFIYAPNNRSITVNRLDSTDFSTFINNLQSGFIAVCLYGDKTYRYENGVPVKAKTNSKPVVNKTTTIQTITGTTRFGRDLYTWQNVQFDRFGIDARDVYFATRFTDVTSPSVPVTGNDPYYIFVTIMNKRSS